MICVFGNAGNEMPASISQLQAALELDFGYVFQKNVGAGSLKY